METADGIHRNGSLHELQHAFEISARVSLVNHDALEIFVVEAIIFGRSGHDHALSLAFGETTHGARDCVEC